MCDYIDDIDAILEAEQERRFQEYLQENAKNNAGASDELAKLFDGAKAKTFDEIKEIAAALQEGEKVMPVIQEMVKAQLLPTELDALFKLIKKSTQYSMASIKAEYKEVCKEKEEPEKDWGIEVAKEVLKRYYTFNSPTSSYYTLCYTASGDYYYYTGKFWQHELQSMIVSLCHTVATEMLHDFQKEIGKSRDAAVKHIYAIVATRTNFYDAENIFQPIVNCNNGELHLHYDGSYILKPHDPKSNQTYVIPANYDPTATCPQFDMFLASIFKDAEEPEKVIQHVWELIGYTIQPNHNIHAYWLFYGPKGRNGKSTLTKIIMALLGKNTSLCVPVETLENRFTTAELAGKLLHVDDDVKFGTRLPDDIMKKVSSQTEMSGEFKGKNFFKFQCNVVSILCCNSFPVMADITGAQRERAIVVPFDTFISEKDRNPNVAPWIIKHELSGIINKAIIAHKQLRERGYFEKCIDIRKATNLWFAQANPLSTFIDEECFLFERDNELYKETKVSIREFWEKFRQWSVECNINKTPARNTMIRNLEALGLEVFKTMGEKHIRGLRVDYTKPK